MFSRLVERLGRMRKDERGFTLIELLVVVAIIGILVAIALPQFIKQTDKARIGQAKAELGMMRSVLEIAYNESETGEYPDTVPEMVSTLNNGGVTVDADTKDPWGQYYQAKPSASTFTIYSRGPNKADGGNDDIVATPDGVGAEQTESGGLDLKP
ncbi:MAG: prepilin-type N-terminal cleavage/methylation domain-containing protein [Bacillota bacterium]|nr:prepilin-type N-terminal cleavage/methylation domain-containing protein [Thermoanaerobacteraceae bacterium]